MILQIPLNLIIYYIIFTSQGLFTTGRNIQYDNSATYEVDGMCQRPDSSANSQSNVYEQWSPMGTLANYTCDPGFYLFGNDHRTCQHNGKWSGEAPLCMKKVSFGKNVSCMGSICNQMLPSDFLLLVDDKPETCAKLPTSSQEVSHWKVDLIENFNGIRAFRFVFHGNSADVPIVRISLQNTFHGSVELLPTECKILQKDLGMGYKELMIYPNVIQSARYIDLEMKTRFQSQEMGFCEAEIYSDRAPSVHQCFDITDLDETQRSLDHIKGTMTFDRTCYTFDSLTNSWSSSNQRCKSTNGGKLAHDISVDVNSAMISFVKARNYVSHYWLGGHTDRHMGTKGAFYEWQWITGRNVDQQLWNPINSPPNNECIGFHAPNGVWMNFPCHSYIGSVCQTEIKRCGSPDMNNGVKISDQFNSYIGARISHECVIGYTLVGDVQRECLPMGIWSGKSPECIHNDAVAYRGQLEMTQGAIIGIIIAGIILGLLIIVIIISVIVIKRRGSFKKTIHFKKDKHGESAETLEETDTKKSKERLSSVETQNYQSVSQEQTQIESH